MTRYMRDEDTEREGEAEAVSPVKKVVKAVKKSPKPKVPATHPSYSVMIAKAISSLKERGGSSKAAILKYIVENFDLGNGSKVAVNARVKSSLRAGVKSKLLWQVKGTGASGSFRLGDKAKVAKPKVAKKSPAKKAGVKSKKAATPKKGGTPDAKKSSKKAAAKKSPKSPAAKKPATKKSPKKAAGSKSSKKAAGSKSSKNAP